MRASIKYYLFIVLFSNVWLISCNKFLDEQSDNSLSVPKRLEDLQALLDDADFMNDWATPSSAEASTDNYFLPDDIYSALSDDSKKAYTWIPYDYYASNDWSYGYRCIYNANYCLEMLNNIHTTESNGRLYNNIKGSALFFRAYHFLNLVWVYAKVYDEALASSDNGIVLRLNADFNTPSFRSSIQSSYDRIISDLKEALLYLPENALNVMRPSQGAAFGTLARAYLSMQKYDSAYKYANLGLLVNNILLDYNDESAVSYSSNVPFQPFNPEIIFYSTMNPISVNIATNRARVDTSLYEQYEETDLRKLAFFRPTGDYQRFKGSYAAHVSRLFSGIATDELFLIRSECQARSGNIQEALSDLRELLSKRYVINEFFIPVEVTTKEAALSLILTERRKELLFRGLRWSDIKRLNNEGADIILQREISGEKFVLLPNDNKYALPIPKDVIEQSGIAQNEF